MNRTLRYGTLLAGSLLLGACGSDDAPPDSTLYPAPEYVDDDPAQSTTQLSGFAWDPEAFFINLVNCPFPDIRCAPFLLDQGPLYGFSAMQKSSIFAFDPVTGGPSGEPVQSDDLGVWSLYGVPSRSTVPYFVTALPTGSLSPAASVPKGNYLPTVTLRPVVTHNSVCHVQEAASISTVGILEAVAKRLTANGSPTTVADFTNDKRFASVVVFWNYQPGSPLLRAPASCTTVKATVNNTPVGESYNVNWAPPGVLPPFLQQSTRGYFVDDQPATDGSGTKVSGLGITVFLLRASTSAPPREITFNLVDPTPPYDPANDTLVPDADPTANPCALKNRVKDKGQIKGEQFNPWRFQTIAAPPMPGIITFAGNQMWRKNQPNGPEGAVSPNLCLPLPAP
ncbi:hypothetical protein SAMN05444354_10455 [Stigmatella aurantiaca]|uniref:Lipoprotein n=1 Tax=Stigmatella aurantiaca TaxID=41 RepID=A0A1H7MNR1_STIAU|nr:hypothetical protein [Stigmatella aurantiaca]SEL12843.1 hypothetical protein SAMN05444354_10455 [Stigmatella aurantiaca]